MTWPPGDPAYSAPPPPPPPPPLPYQQGPYGQPPAAAVPPRKSRKNLIVALVAGVVILGVIAAVVVIRLVLTKEEVGATDLAVGQCIPTIPNGDLVDNVPTVGCETAHAGEVYAVLTIPGTDYPGQATIEEWQNKCPAELQSYLKAPLTDDSVKVFVLYPTEQTWGLGDHAVTCIATTEAQRTGSLKG